MLRTGKSDDVMLTMYVISKGIVARQLRRSTLASVRINNVETRLVHDGFEKYRVEDSVNWSHRFVFCAFPISYLRFVLVYWYQNTLHVYYKVLLGLLAF